MYDYMNILNVLLKQGLLVMLMEMHVSSEANRP